MHTMTSQRGLLTVWILLATGGNKSLFSGSIVACWSFRSVRTRNNRTPELKDDREASLPTTAVSPKRRVVITNGLRHLVGGITAGTIAFLPIDKRGTAGSTAAAAIQEGNGAGGLPSSNGAGGRISQRLEQDILQQPPSQNPKGGVDNTVFPDYLEGTWDVTQTLVDVSAPLGLAYLGGPNGLASIGAKSLEDAKKRIGEPVHLQLRYVPTAFGVVEDRLFNGKQRLDAFAGKTVVAAAQYADVQASNRASVLATPGGKASDPLETVVIRFKGPAAQKTFITSHGSEQSLDKDSGSSWVGYEGQRSIFTLTNENPAPPIWTDSELIWKFDLISDDHVQGRLRLASYLNAQSDKLYFEARKRAVSLQDYTLDMRRIEV